MDYENTLCSSRFRQSSILLPCVCRFSKRMERMAVGAYDIGKWHLDSHNYELPYNYAKGLVEL